jgi:hypothetical protein
MAWGFVWLMLVLKIPIGMLLYIVWWAVKQETDPETEGSSDDGGTKVRPRPPHRPGGRGRDRFPRRRGPHGEPVPTSPSRVRTTVVRARDTQHD